MVYKFLRWLKANVTEEQFKDILAATVQDIKFNRIEFGKTTEPKKFIEICTSRANIILKNRQRKKPKDTDQSSPNGITKQSSLLYHKMR